MRYNTITIEDLLMQGRKIKYDVIRLTETRSYRLVSATYNAGEELFLGTCDRRGAGGVGVLVNTRMAVNIDSFEQLTTRIGHLRLKRCVSRAAVTIFVAYAPTLLERTGRKAFGVHNDDKDHP